MASVLFVDDNALLARYSRAFILARLPRAEVMVAHSAAQARRLFARHSPKMVILDIRLPDGSGLDLLRELASQGTPSFGLISAEAVPVCVQDELRPLGLVGTLIKPYEADELARMVERGLAEERESAGRSTAPESETMLVLDAARVKRQLTVILGELFELRADVARDATEGGLQRLAAERVGPLIELVRELSGDIARARSIRR